MRTVNHQRLPSIAPQALLRILLLLHVILPPFLHHKNRPPQSLPVIADASAAALADNEITIARRIRAPNSSAYGWLPSHWRCAVALAVQRVSTAQADEQLPVSGPLASVNSLSDFV